MQHYFYNHVETSCTYLMSINSDWNAECSGQPEVRQFNDTLTVDEQVLGLEITVQHSPLVAKQDTLKDLVKVTL